MKIIIVGAGIAGLSTYLCLRKHLAEISGFEIKIYEGHDIARYVSRVAEQTSQKTATAPEQTEAEILARNNLVEEAFNIEAIGSAIGIPKNGLDVLSRLFDSAPDKDGNASGSSQILKDMVKQGHPITRWEMSCARGWMLADVSIVPKAWREKEQAVLRGKANRASPSSHPSSDESVQNGRIEELREPPVTGIMIGRQAFWSILLQCVVKLAGSDAIQHLKVSEILISDDGNVLPQIKFANGSSEEADLIIGADGLRSIVRKCMFTPSQSVIGLRTEAALAHTSWLQGFLSHIISPFKSATISPKDYITPHYEGLAGVGGFVPASVLSGSGQKPGSMSIVFGPNGFFGHGFISTGLSSSSSPASSGKAAETPPEPVAVYWSTFSSSDPYPYAMDTSAGTKPRWYDFDRAKAHSALLARHKDWQNPMIQAILEYIKTHPQTQPEGFYPTWTTPELPHWSSRGRVVLVGDAAHALQPSSGQGASQALEDAEALALILKHSLSTISTTKKTPDIQARAFESAMQSYETVRMPRVHAIYERSQKMSGMKADMGFLMEMFMYAIIKIMSLFHDDHNAKLVNYDLPRDVERVLQSRSHVDST